MANLDTVDPKEWYTSKTLWASIAQVAVGIAVSVGIITPDSATSIVSQLPELIVGLLTSGLGLLSFWGRYTATKQIA